MRQAPDRDGGLVRSARVSCSAALLRSGSALRNPSPDSTGGSCERRARRRLRLLCRGRPPVPRRACVRIVDRREPAPDVRCGNEGRGSQVLRSSAFARLPAAARQGAPCPKFRRREMCSCGSRLTSCRRGLGGLVRQAPDREGGLVRSARVSCITALLRSGSALPNPSDTSAAGSHTTAFPVAATSGQGTPSRAATGIRVNSRPP